MLKNKAEPLAPLDGPRRREAFPPMNNLEDDNDAVVVEASNVQFSPLKSAAVKTSEEREAAGVERSLAAVSRLIQRVTDALEVSLGGMQAWLYTKCATAVPGLSLHVGHEGRKKRTIIAVDTPRFLCNSSFQAVSHTMDARTPTLAVLLLHGHTARTFQSPVVLPCPSSVFV